MFTCAASDYREMTVQVKTEQIGASS
jgi:hypothetical protein